MFRGAEKFFTFIFQLSGWALVAPSCFALQVPDVRVATRVPGSMLQRDVELAIPFTGTVSSGSFGDGALSLTLTESAFPLVPSCTAAEQLTG